MVIFVSLLILIASPWFLSLSIYLKVITVLVTVFFYFIKIKEKFNLKMLTAAFFIISLLVVTTSVLSRTDVKTKVGMERELASNTKFSKLSAFFSNKYVESYRLNENLFFQNLDFGNYFFAGHPRERAGIEIQKFFAATLVLIIFGFIKMKNNLRLFLLSLYIFSISFAVFLKDTSPNGNFLALPVLAFLGGSGFISLTRDYAVKGKIILVITLLVLGIEGASYYATV